MTKYIELKEEIREFNNHCRQLLEQSDKISVKIGKI